MAGNMKVKVDLLSYSLSSLTVYDDLYAVASDQNLGKPPGHRWPSTLENAAHAMTCTITRKSGLGVLDIHQGRARTGGSLCTDLLLCSWNKLRFKSTELSEYYYCKNRHVLSSLFSRETTLGSYNETKVTLITF